MNVVAFAYYYNTEFALYIACKNNNVPVKLWNKECFMSDPHVKYRIKLNEYKKFFSILIKYQFIIKFMKKMLISMDHPNKYKFQ